MSTLVPPVEGGTTGGIGTQLTPNISYIQVILVLVPYPMTHVHIKTQLKSGRLVPEGVFYIWWLVTITVTSYLKVKNC